MKTINNLKSISKEIWDNRVRLLRLSIYDLKSMNSGTFFGYFWHFLLPAINLGVYFLAFGVGLKQNDSTYPFPFVIWLMTGLMPWLFISSSITQGAGAIGQYSGIVKRMPFPLSIVPIKPIITNYFVHVCSMLIVLLVYAFTEGLSVYAFQLIYYNICSLALLVALSFLFSTLSVISKDFKKILSPVIRLFFFVSPIFWNYETRGGIFSAYLPIVRSINPFSYIIEGYRYSLVDYTHIDKITGDFIAEYSYSPFWTHWDRALIFWATVLIVFVIGINIHANLRKKFVDLI